jgi:hypothetical protein
MIAGRCLSLNFGDEPRPNHRLLKRIFIMLRRITLCFSLTMLAAFSGCSTWSKNSTTSKDSPWSISKLWKKEYQQPQSMAIIWAPDVLTVPGKPATRGFGGRVYFYNELSQAIPIEGELMIHGYAKQTRMNRTDEVAADKTFGFTAEQLAGHFSPSDMGASYSIWIPWDAADGVREEVTLIPTFKGKDGTIVQGSAAKANLPGRTADGKPEPIMQTVSYSQSSAATNMGFEPEPPAKTMRTTTINVPSNASLAKPRRLESVTLNTQAPANKPVLPEAVRYEGFSTGGGAGEMSAQQSQLPKSPEIKLPALKVPNLHDMPELSQPAGNYQPMEFKSLAPPPMAKGIPKASPLPKSSLPDWTQRTQPVQRASFVGDN